MHESCETAHCIQGGSTFRWGYRTSNMQSQASGKIGEVELRDYSHGPRSQGFSFQEVEAQGCVNTKPLLLPAGLTMLLTHRGLGERGLCQGSLVLGGSALVLLSTAEGIPKGCVWVHEWLRYKD